MQRVGATLEHVSCLGCTRTHLVLGFHTNTYEFIFADVSTCVFSFIDLVKTVA